MATMSSTQGGLPNAVARRKTAAMSLTIGLSQEQEQANAEQAVESNDDIIEEIQGHPQDGHQHYTSAMNVETITSATRRSPLMRRRREWSGRQDD
jgi:hypothetical protein